jgi:hypothetical protein
MEKRMTLSFFSEKKKEKFFKEEDKKLEKVFVVRR